MIRKYYHSCLTCPNCHQPHKGSYSDPVGLNIEDPNLVSCSSCESEFYPCLNLNNKPGFSETLNRAIDLAGLPFFQHKAKIPLYWYSSLNKIEESYKNWIMEKPEGAFLVTWPWDEVRFIPVLLTEYCINNPGASVVVIDNFKNPAENKDFIAGYSLPEIIQKTVFIDEPEPPQGNLKKEMKIFKRDESLLFEKQSVIEVKFKKYGAGTEENDTWICRNRLNKCTNGIKKEFFDNYGKGSLRKIVRRKMNGTESLGYNEKDITEKIVDPETGHWVITLTEQERWSGKMAYNHLWFYEVLANQDKIHSCQEILQPVIYDNSDDELQKKPGNVHIISSGSDSGRVMNLFRLVKEISPDILIIRNVDDFIRDRRYRGRMSSELLGYMGNPAKSTFLFSTDPEMRQFYELDKDQNFMDLTGCTVQTLDSTDVIQSLGNNFAAHGYPSPLSSDLNNLMKNRSHRINATYIENEELTKFSEIILSLANKINSKLEEDIRFYIRRVVSSPLNVIGDYSRPEFLVAKKGFRGPEITYDLIYTDLEMSASDAEISLEIPLQFRNLFKENYLPEPGLNKNPLRDLIINEARRILENNSGAYVTVVVNYYDVKGFERIIRKEELISEEHWVRFAVSNWSSLSGREAVIENSKSHYVISSQYPTLKYSLRKSDVTEFIFISDSKGINAIKEIINRRLLETIVYPLIKPKKDDLMPCFLREILDSLEIPDTNRIGELYEDIDDEHFTFSRLKKTERPDDFGSYDPEIILNGLEAGEEMFLCIDHHGEGMFIPVDHTVMIRSGGFFSDITIDKSKSDAAVNKILDGKEIIISKSGIYLSFRTIFFKFMMKNGHNISFRKHPYTWEGFEELFISMTRWIRFIEKVVIQYGIREECSPEEAIAVIAEKLAKSGITATEPGTVIGWCKHYEDITLDSGIYRVYKTEHPFRCEDLNIIFDTLNEIISEAVPEDIDSDKIYAASLCLQNLRNKVLKAKSDDDDPRYKEVRAELSRELEDVISDAEIFIPMSIQRVMITKSVEPMKHLIEYEQYI